MNRIIGVPEFIGGVGRAYGRGLCDYPNDLEDDNYWPIVIENIDCNAYDIRSSNWLALNPSIGQRMNWRLVKDARLPIWVDANGDEMARSVWWSDGLIHTGSAAPNNVVGEGWIVLASESALTALRDRFGPLQLRASWIRSLETGGGHPVLERTHEEVKLFQ